MKLRELRLTGFKSFVDPVRVPIEAGLTGIVGPNGCGKSNLLESVRWAMGATSAKAMRGGDMDDVIFAGSAQRPAREQAEVVIALDNADRKAPAAFNDTDELEISRRIRKGLGSTYRINGREVRAKDVQLLFADASTGANSPALVRQGQISELIAAKPENRRRILEEAAGIGGLQARRHEADLKLRATEANLTRLEEVIAEIDGQAQSLKKQARQAERYRVVADDLRRVEALLMHRRHDEALVARGQADADRRAGARAVAEAAEKASVAQRISLEAQGRLAPLREEEMIAAAVLRRLEGVRVGLERDVKDAEDAIARLKDDLARFRADREREEKLLEDSNEALARLNEEAGALNTRGDDPAALAAAQTALQSADAARTEAEARLESEAAGLAARRARAEGAARALRDVEVRLTRIVERFDSASRDRKAIAAPDEKQRKALQAAFEKASAALQAADAALVAAEEKIASAQAAERAALAPLREAESKVQTLAAEAKALTALTAAPKAQSFPPALDQIKAEPGYERAVAAALGEDAEAALDAKAPARWAGAPEKHTIWSWPTGVAPLSRFIEAPDELSERIKFCGVIEDASNALDLMQTLPPGALLVSREGDLWRWDGFVREAGAASHTTAARLEHANRLKAIASETKSAEAAVNAARKAWEQARETLAKAEAERGAARAKMPEARSAADKARTESQRFDAEAERVATRIAALDAQISAQSSERSEVETALKAAQDEAASAPSADAPTSIEEARAQAQRAREAAAEARASVAAITRERDQRTARANAIAQESGSWTARAESAAARIEALTKAEADAEAKLKAARDAPEQARAKLNALDDEAKAAETRRAAAADKLAAQETRVRETDRATRTAEALHAQEREARAGADVRFEAAHVRVETLVARIKETIGLDPDDLPARAGDLMNGPLHMGPVSDVERKADRLRAERDAAGPVNLRAEAELRETQARLETLQAERADVAAAVAKLRRGINALNTEGRERLLAAFNIVNEHFAALFATLFEGGVAELKLIQPDEESGKDPLAAGLEIFAQPPGKRLATLSLMSGGEQALTAAALIFAVFLANPAPLCVLDEVDAPLDDANVDRFCRMLDEMRKRTDTRFLVITHNPMTMARMDRLYGVTMAEQGVSSIVSVDLQRATELAAA